MHHARPWPESDASHCALPGSDDGPVVDPGTWWICGRLTNIVFSTLYLPGQHIQQCSQELCPAVLSCLEADGGNQAYPALVDWCSLQHAANCSYSACLLPRALLFPFFNSRGFQFTSVLSSGDSVSRPEIAVLLAKDAIELVPP